MLKNLEKLTDCQSKYICNRTHLALKCPDVSLHAWMHGYECKWCVCVCVCFVCVCVGACVPECVRTYVYVRMHEWMLG